MSFAKPQFPQRQASVPLAPMIDILFLLIIFFVTTSSFRAEEREVDVNLPASESSQRPAERPSEVVVNVRADGSILIGASEHSLESVRATLAALAAEFPDERLIIRGDRQTMYEHIIAVMDAARAAGLRNIYFATVRSADEVGQ